MIYFKYIFLIIIYTYIYIVASMNENFYFTHPILNPDVLLTSLQARSPQDFACNWWFHHDEWWRCSLVRSSSLMKTRLSHFMFCNQKNKRFSTYESNIFFFFLRNKYNYFCLQLRIESFIMKFSIIINYFNTFTFNDW